MFYHGSQNPLLLDTVLSSKEDEGYTSSKDCFSIENAFEYYRPSDKIPRRKAVYMVDNPDGIIRVGGKNDYIYEVEPEGKVERGDLYWYNLTSKEMGIVFEVEDITEKAKKFIENYWNGVESENPKIEYRTNSGRVTKEFTPNHELAIELEGDGFEMPESARDYFKDIKEAISNKRNLPVNQKSGFLNNFKDSSEITDYLGKDGEDGGRPGGGSPPSPASASVPKMKGPKP